MNRLEEAIKNLRLLEKDGADPQRTAEVFLEFDEAQRVCQDAPLWQFGLPRDLLSRLSTIKDNHWEEAAFKVADRYFQKSLKDDLPHSLRRENQEAAIRLLLNYSRERKGKLKSKTFALLARAYLERSRIIHPKGKTIPEKKKEALQKGIRFAEEALAKDQKNREVWRLKAQLYLELEDVGEKPEDFENVLREAIFDHQCIEFDNKKEDVRIAIRYSFFNRSDSQLLQGIVDSRLPDIELEKAWAYALLKQEEQVKKIFGLILSKLGDTHFADPIWDKTVELLKLLKKDRLEGWKVLSLSVYEACVNQENDTSYLYLRWYWARLRDLYDLAFLAVANDNLEKKAEIADSLKSRPALRWTVWESLSKKDKRAKTIFDAVSDAYGGKYIKRSKIIGGSGKSSPALSSTKTTAKIPPGLIVIHFYLTQLDDDRKGYAVIYNSDSKKWMISDFKYDELFTALNIWQTEYIRYKHQAETCLVKLCEMIGKTMPFLFLESFVPHDKSVLFIPHDFLHRLPLHGAINSTNSYEVLLVRQKKPIWYLPAWSLAPDGSPNNSDKSYFLINLEKESERRIFEKLLKDLEDSSRREVHDPAKPGDLTSIRDSPSLVVIICHGIADSVNPFNAKLMLKDGGLSHLEIIKSGADFHGSKVVLGACESDLVPPLSDTMDEHLSISAGFLGRAASEVLGGMWKISGQDVQNLVKEISRKENIQIADALHTWQQGLIGDFQDIDGIFFRLIAFRVFGFPAADRP